MRRHRKQRAGLTCGMSWETMLSRPSHRHCRHRCERPLRMDAPSTGWVTVLAGLLARGSSALVVRPSQFPSGRVGPKARRSQLRGQPRISSNSSARICCARVPFFRPRFASGNQHDKMFARTLELVKHVDHRGPAPFHARARTRDKMVMCCQRPVRFPRSNTNTLLALGGLSGHKIICR